MIWKRPLVVATLASLCATAAIAILVLLFGDFGETEGRVLGTTAAISLYSLLTLPGGVLLERRQAPGLAWATIAFPLAAFLLALVVIWGIDDDEGGGKRAATATVFAAALTQIAALTTRRRADDRAGIVAVYRCSVGLPLLLATLVSVAIWKEIEADGFYRALAALAVLNVLLIVSQPLLRRLGQGLERTRVVLEGTPAQIEDALRRVEGSGVRVRR